MEIYIYIYIYIALAPRWSIAHPQFSSTVLCPGLDNQFGSIADLFVIVLVRLIFSSCFLASQGFSFLEDSRKVPAYLPSRLILYLLISFATLLSTSCLEYGSNVPCLNLNGSPGCEKSVRPCSVHIVGLAVLRHFNYLKAPDPRLLPLLLSCSVELHYQGYDEDVQQLTWWDSLFERRWAFPDIYRAHLVVPVHPTETRYHPSTLDREGSNFA